MFKPDTFFIAFCRFNLGHHHVDRIDICGGADFGDHDQIKPFTGLFDDVDHIAIHVVRVQSVDSNRHGFVAPINLVQCFYDVFSGLFFLIGCNGIFKI